MAELRQTSPPIESGCCGNIFYNFHARFSLSGTLDIPTTTVIGGTSSGYACWRPIIRLQRYSGGSRGTWSTIGTRDISSARCGGVFNETFTDVRKSSSAMRFLITRPGAFYTKQFNHR